MKRAALGVAITSGLVLVLSMATSAQSGMMGRGHMGHSETMVEPAPGSPKGMMGPSGLPHSLEGIRIPHLNQLVQVLKAELALLEEQTKKVKEYFFQVMKANIKQRAGAVTIAKAY